MKAYVAGWRQRAKEMFVPLVHSPGHALADFGKAMGIIEGVERQTADLRQGRDGPCGSRARAILPPACRSAARHPCQLKLRYEVLRLAP
jgi:hypothetical protein